jgi:hypothetical protein
MIKKRVLDHTRIRCISGGFSFIPHRFLTGGFLAALDPNEVLLYFLLVLAADRRGLSFYSYDRICSILKLSVEQYIDARQALIRKDLIAFDGTLFQVLQLPEKPAIGAGSTPEPIAALRQLAKQIGREVSDENR